MTIRPTIGFKRFSTLAKRTSVVCALCFGAVLPWCLLAFGGGSLDAQRAGGQEKEGRVAPKANELEDGSIGTEEELNNLPEGVMIRVGDFEVTAGDIIARAFEQESYKDSSQQDIRSAYRYYIGSLLLRAEAKRLEVEVSEELKQRVVDAQIEAIKRRVAESTGGALPFGEWLRGQGMTIKSLRDRIYQASDNIYLRKLLVTHYEETNESVTYYQIRMLSEAAAKRVLAKIDAEIAAAGPDDSKQDIFNKLGFLNNEIKGNMLIRAYPDDDLPNNIKKAVFEDLEPGAYSRVLKHSDNDWRIVFLVRRTPASNRTIDEVAATVEEDLGAVEDSTSNERFFAWVIRVQNAGNQRVLAKLPELPELVERKGEDPKDAGTAKDGPKDTREARVSGDQPKEAKGGSGEASTEGKADVKPAGTDGPIPSRD